MRGLSAPQAIRVPQHSWWLDLKGRTWVVIGFIYQNNQPEDVMLLELGSAEYEIQPYSLIREYIENRTFRQLLKKI